ncbi:DUF4261 domain-containing protein [Mesosutterella sp. OilRF-GAM-744-9]|uniref:DUF4261 domain-containing protein n=2 Tax=Mesosutterella TaxID=2494213 RepID=A0ABS9MQT4_9BURK|nr:MULTISPECIES: DUF4261 domain-containing protein [unclassified Mesosutterella]MCG5030984.1 DUF4261 domain-containing protein [Mesosutterella sp. oilRF-744-WT-GAM-9]MDL2059711.1 DUF4261 domain-containing protein [Mesosutterella sp. AGMB02718]
MAEDKKAPKDNPATQTVVLLARPEFSAKQYAQNLKADWGFETEDSDVGEENGSLVTLIDGMMVCVAMTPVPVPDGRAQRQAQTNYLWPEAQETAKAHQAYVTVSVQHNGHEPLDAGCLAVKLTASALKQAAACGVLTAGTFMSPLFYKTNAEADCRRGRVPVMNLVYFGLYPHEDGECMNGYTFGLARLGAREVEVIRSLHEPQDIFNLMVTAATYMLDYHVRLKAGDTIGQKEGESFPITDGPGRAVDGNSLKIAY